MTEPLQTKDDQWRERGNAAEPVRDLGAAPLGTDAEAGGAPAPAPSASQRDRPPMAPEPDPGSGGAKLPPIFWIMVAAAMLAAVVVAAAMSF